MFVHFDHTEGRVPNIYNLLDNAIKYCDEDYAVKSPFHAEFRSVGIFTNFKDMNECVLFFNSASP